MFLRCCFVSSRTLLIGSRCCCDREGLSLGTSESGNGLQRSAAAPRGVIDDSDSSSVVCVMCSARRRFSPLADKNCVVVGKLCLWLGAIGTAGS